MEALKTQQLPLAEAVQLAAADSVFFSHYFFPKTVRQGTPDFHREMWSHLDSAERKVAFEVFRGGAKTTLLRLYLAKRVAFLISRTVLFVGKSQDHARRSLAWIMRQVEFNSLYRDAFQLRPGVPWTSEVCQILVGPSQTPVTILALGITGSTRGINVDDYRPDLIVVDDPSDEENTATADQRTKTEDYILGSLYNSLAPASEEPLAKIAFLQTLLHPEDAISACMKDPTWASAKFPIIMNNQSAWPERWSYEDLLAEKKAYTDRGKLYLWMREMECQVIGSADLSFPSASDQIRYYQVPPSPGSMMVAMAVDPVPPPSEREIERGLKGKDEEVWIAVGLWKDRTTKERRIYVLDLRANKGHTPDWSISTFLSMKNTWMPEILKAESVNYQRTLAWLLEKAMRAKGQFMRIDAYIPERRKKSYRIIDTLGDALAEGLLYFHESQHELISQIVNYPSVSHDDRIEALAVAVAAVLDLSGHFLGDFDDILEAERDLPDIPDIRICP
jgi:hypothetical protein